MIIEVNLVASIRKVVKRRLEGLLRKMVRADKGRKTKGLFLSPLKGGAYEDGLPR